MPGPTGVTGMVGLQGLRGVVGPPRYGFPGPAYGLPNARITVNTPTSSPIYLTPQNFGTYFNITSNAVVSDALTVSFPFYNPTYGVGPTGVLYSARGYTTYIMYTLTGPVSAIGLRENSLVTITADPVWDSPTNVVPTGQVRVSNPSGNTFSVITPTTNSIELIAPTTIPPTVIETTAVERTNEAYPTPEQTGSFWAFKNNCLNTVTITLSNGSVTYQGVPGVISIPLESGNGFSILYSGTNGFIVI